MGTSEKHIQTTPLCQKVAPCRKSRLKKLQLAEKSPLKKLSLSFIIDAGSFIFGRVKRYVKAKDHRPAACMEKHARPEAAYHQGLPSVRQDLFCIGICQKELQTHSVPQLLRESGLCFCLFRFSGDRQHRDDALCPSWQGCRF